MPEARARPSRTPRRLRDAGRARSRGGGARADVGPGRIWGVAQGAVRGDVGRPGGAVAVVVAAAVAAARGRAAPGASRPSLALGPSAVLRPLLLTALAGSRQRAPGEGRAVGEAGGPGLWAAGRRGRTRQAPGGRRLSPPACRRRRCGANSGPPPPPLLQGASHAEPGARRPGEPGARGQVGFPPGGPRAARTARETPLAACPRFTSAAREEGREGGADGRPGPRGRRHEGNPLQAF